jgi:hypothetical protein
VRFFSRVDDMMAKQSQFEETQREFVGYIKKGPAARQLPLTIIEFRLMPCDMPQILAAKEA